MIAHPVTLEPFDSDRLENAGGGEDDLYEARLLGFARRADGWPQPSAPMRMATRSSRICGSRMTVGAVLDEDGRVRRYGHTFDPACVLTRAAASVLAAAIFGRDRAAVLRALAALDRCLAHRSDAAALAAAWPDLDLLAPVADIPTRHESVRLPFLTALDALPEAPPG